MKKKMQAGGMADSYIDTQKKVLGPYGKSVMKAKNGAKITKAKKGGSFPDLSGDGKVTKKDILMGKGVIPKKSGKAMYGKTMKAKSGAKMPMKKMMGGGKCKNGC